MPCDLILLYVYVTRSCCHTQCKNNFIIQLLLWQIIPLHFESYWTLIPEGFCIQQAYVLTHIFVRRGNSLRFHTPVQLDCPGTWCWAQDHTTPSAEPQIQGQAGETSPLWGLYKVKHQWNYAHLSEHCMRHCASILDKEVFSSKFCLFKIPEKEVIYSFDTVWKLDRFFKSSSLLVISHSFSNK